MYRSFAVLEYHSSIYSVTAIVKGFLYNSVVMLSKPPPGKLPQITLYRIITRFRKSNRSVIKTDFLGYNDVV